MAIELSLKYGPFDPETVRALACDLRGRKTIEEPDIRYLADLLEDAVAWAEERSAEE